MRTWVSGVGDDANPCSRTAPCRTVAGAISKTAAGGEINVLDPTALGAFTVTKSITVDAGGVFASATSSGATGVTVNAGANDVVVLRGFVLNGAGSTPGFNGIRYVAGKAVYVEDLIIERFGTNPGHGINMTAAGELHVSNSVIRNNGGSAIFVNSAGRASVSVNGSRLQNNDQGIDARGDTRVTVHDTQITGNTNAGLRAQSDRGLTEINADRVLLAFNAIGAQVGVNPNAAIVRLGSSTVVNNGTGLSRQNPSSLLSAGSNRIVGNGTNGSFTDVVTTPPAPAPVVSCSPRPKVSVQTTSIGAGQFRVTIGATTAGGATNTIQELRFGAAQNATIVGGSVPAGSPSGRVVALPGGSASTTFTVQRVDAGQAFTVPVTVTDACGTWPTFVGAGAGSP